MKNVAIIPARGGSKRIPNKNIKEFINRPIISYAIQLAQKTEIFDDIIVSTDSQEIKEISIKYGARVPFLRSKENSSDYAIMVDVLLEVLSDLEVKENNSYDYVTCIFPCTPLLKASDIKLAYNIIKKNHYDAAMPIIKYSHPPQRAYQIINNNLEMLNPENYKTRTQDLVPLYHDAGQFYIFNVESLRKYKDNILTKSKIVPIILSNSNYQDVDTLEDWKQAEIKYNIQRLQNLKIDDCGLAYTNNKDD